MGLRNIVWGHQVLKNLETDKMKNVELKLVSFLVFS